MQFKKEEALRVESLALAGSEKLIRRCLIIGADENPFFNSRIYASDLKYKLQKIHKEEILVESASPVIDSIASFQKLVRLIQRFDSIQVFFHGTVSFVRNIMPAVFISRFYGKELSLHYYPENVIDQIPKIHHKIMPLCSKVFVSSKYEQRLLSKYDVRSEVKHQPLSIEWPVREISEIQPHILIAHDDTSDAGAECVIQAYRMVKEKYPRTVITNITSEMIDWQREIQQQQRSSHGDFYADPNNPEQLRAAFTEADIFVNCLSSESAPMALLAAIATGIPSISFESYGAREIIENGVNGFLIRHYDHNQLSDRIIELIEQPELVLPISKAAAKIRTKLNAL